MFFLDAKQVFYNSYLNCGFRLGPSEKKQVSLRDPSFIKARKTHDVPVLVSNVKLRRYKTQPTIFRLQDLWITTAASSFVSGLLRFGGLLNVSSLPENKLYLKKYYFVNTPVYTILLK